AESQFHHPEITFGWGYCRVEFQTRKIGGLLLTSIDHEKRSDGDLISGVEGWELNDDATRISSTFKFKDFPGAQAFASRVSDLAESQFHHPEITFGWGYCRVEFQTRKIRGLHENDFIMAAKVNELHKGAGVEQG
ncbi:MAG: 4a-hydroxytetrahydrobiopterin dehydratase, partial [Nitrospinota bacterium]